MSIIVQTKQWGQVVIGWKHHINSGLRPDKAGVLRKSECTKCYARILRRKDFLACEGYAYKSPEDQYVKSTGRKVSFDRMVRTHFDNKEDRRALWSAYIAMRNGKGW